MKFTDGFFVLDAETDGIYGRVLSIAACSVEGLNETAHFYGAVKTDIGQITEPWVRENVFNYLGNAETFYDSETELIEAFWQFYELHGEGLAVVCDVPYPVEDGIFRRCIERDRTNRTALSPFPLYDLESMLVSRGYDRMTDRRKLAGIEIPCHDAMNDVKLIVKIMEVLYGSNE